MFLFWVEAKHKHHKAELYKLWFCDWKELVYISFFRSDCTALFVFDNHLKAKLYNTNLLLYIFSFSRRHIVEYGLFSHKTFDDVWMS